MSRVAYLGETTGDNMQVSPTQLLELIEHAIKNEPGHPIMGMYAILIREAPDGTLHTNTFRAGLPKFVEVAVASRVFIRTVGAAIADE